MDLRKITDGINQLFTEDNRIVFWNDANAEFEEVIDSLNLDDIVVLNLDKEGELAVKIRIECEEPEKRFLLYSAKAKPSHEEDWLLDIRCYSKTFHADRAAMILTELGLVNQFMRPHIAKRIAFFNARERLNKLLKTVEPEDTEEKLDLKILAILTKTIESDFFSILISIFHSIADDLDKDDAHISQLEEPAVFKDIQKYGLDNFFWELVKREFGYESENPKFSNLLVRLFVTDFSRSLLSVDTPAPLKSQLLPDGMQSANTSVCLSRWRESITFHESYDFISNMIAKAVNVDELLTGIESSDIQECVTFQAVEKALIRGMRDHVLGSKRELDLEQFLSNITLRKDKHWVTSQLKDSDNVTREAYRQSYHALCCAAELKVLREKYNEGFSFSSAEKMYKAYETELYLFDRLYRHFNEAAEIVQSYGGDLLKELRDYVENLYLDWFIPRLSLAWGHFLEPDDSQPKKGLLNKWRLDSVQNQHQFYLNHISPHVKSTSITRRIFVIISDALRFEAAQELFVELNSKHRIKAELSSQLGVVPSYTALGMAALLPYSNLSFGDHGEVLIDDKATAGIDARKRILSFHEGIAIKAHDLIQMKRDEGREFIKPYKVVYIYHDEIDAVGDDAKTEDKTLQAVRRTINDLGQLTKVLINRFNGSHIIITADHGFLFRMRPLDDVNKSLIREKPANAVLSKKRYIIGKNLGSSLKVLKQNIKITTNADGDMEFWIPKGVNRFHFAGGSRFVHGGAMLQEIVVPVITVKAMRKDAAEKDPVKNVSIQLLGSNHRIVMNRHRFEFIQMDAVSKKTLPLTVQVAVWDDDAPISDVVTITFDSASSQIDERKKSVLLTLSGGQYDRKKTYNIVVQNADSQIELQRYPVTIDLTIASDF